MPVKRVLAAMVGLVVATTLAAGPAAAQHRGTPTGSLVLIGGGLSADNAAIYGDIVRLAGGAGRARIGIVTAASSTPAEDPDAGTPDCNNSVCNGAYYAGLFSGYGADATWIPIDLDHLAAAEDPAVVAQINGLTGFFFGGGDQYRYVRTMKRPNGADTAALAAIRAKLRSGAVVAGTSAGAQIQAGPDMLTGGESYEGLRDGSSPGYFDDAARLGYLPGGGFGFFDAGLLDTHFSARGRLGRSVRLAADTRHDRVFGLDEDTALEVTGVGGSRPALRVLGSAGVHVFDLRSAAVSDGRDGWGIRGVRWTQLSSGDTYDAAQWRLGTTKAPLSPASGRCTTRESADVFAADVLPQLAQALAERRDCRSTSGVTAEDDPRFRVELTRGPRFAAFRSRTGTSLADVSVRIGPA